MASPLNPISPQPHTSYHMAHLPFAAVPSYSYEDVRDKKRGGNEWKIIHQILGGWGNHELKQVILAKKKN